MDAPADILVADLQNGSQVFVKWTAPSGTPVGYYVYKATMETGTYVRKNVNLITNSHFVIPNLSLSDEVFVKVSAVDGDGEESLLSLVGDDADISTNPTVVLDAVAQLNDTIAEGAYFSAKVGGGIVVLQVADEFTFDGIVRLWELDDDNYVEFQADKIVYVFGGVVVAQLRREGWYLKGRKVVLGDLYDVADSTEAPFEWDTGRSTLFAIHVTPTAVRLMGIDVNGNMYLEEHDSQPYRLPATDTFGVFESGDELIWGDGYYKLSLIDRDEKLLFIRGRIIENVVFP